MSDIQALIEQLFDDNHSVHTRASLLLFDAGKAVVRPLLEVLEGTENPTYRRRILTLLGELQSRKALAVLGKAAQDESSLENRLVAINALGQLDDIRCLAYLKAAAQNPDPLVRQRALAVIGEYGIDYGRVVLLEALDDADSSVVRQAAFGLYDHFRASQALPFLLREAQSSNVQFRYEALRVLGKAQQQEAHPYFVENLQHSSLAVQRVAVYGIGQLGNPDDTKALLHHLERVRNPDLQLALVIALGRLGEAQAVQPLLKLLDDAPIPDTRLQIAVAVGRIGDAMAIEALGNLIDHDFDVNVRFQAVLSLADIAHPIAIDMLHDYLQHDNPLIRQAAIKGLGLVRDSEAISFCLERLEDPDRAIAHAAAVALLRMNQHGADTAFERLIRDLYHADYEVCWFTLRTLEQFPDPRFIQPLIAVLDDDDSGVREIAVGILGQIGDPVAIEHLVPLLGDRWAVRRRARQALIALDYDFNIPS